MDLIRIEECFICTGGPGSDAEHVIIHLLHQLLAGQHRLENRMTEISQALADEGAALDDLKNRIGNISGPLLQEVSDLKDQVAGLQSLDDADKASLQAALGSITDSVTAIHAHTGLIEGLAVPAATDPVPAPPADVPPVDAPPADVPPVTATDAPPADVPPADDPTV